jgi:peptide/nickel transport system substrate-binding protein/oligopeptide transport system substrate-binding protein
MSAKWQKGLAVLASVSALTLIVAGCGTGNNNTANNSSGNAASKPIEGGNIVLDETQGLKDLDPALAYDTQSWEVVQQLYDQLVTYAPGTNNTKIVPMDAKSWTISPDKKTYTFTLRSGLKFSNGDAVTAQSFIDEIQRMATKKLGSGGEWLIENIVGEQAFFKGTAKTITGLSAPSTDTLKIQLKDPNAAELEVLAMPFFSAVDSKFITKVGNKAFDSTQAMGNGPFVLKTINSNEVVMTKNPNYWMKDSNGQQLPYLNQVTIRINKNAQADALNYEKGTTAWLGLQQGIPSSAYPHFLATPSLKKTMVEVPQNSVFYLGLNTKIAPFNNKTVRQAMEYAINKKAIIKLFNGRGVVANQPLPPNIPGYEKTLPASASYSYDPTKAKALLKQANVDPSKITLKLYSSNDPDQMKEDQSIQQDLQALGFKVDIKATTWGPFLDVAEKGNAQMFALGWFQDYPDAGDFLTLFTTSQIPVNNSAQYSNKQVDQWYNQSNTSSDQATRIQLFHKITNQVMQDAPWVPLYYPTAYYAVQPWVHGWFAPAARLDPMKYVWIDQSHSAQ